MSSDESSALKPRPAIDAAVGLVAQAANAGYVLIAYVWFAWSNQSDIAAFWLVLSLLISLIQQADFGFQTSLARSLSFVMGGAQRLEKNGVHSPSDINNVGIEINESLATSVLATSYTIYRRLGLAAAFVGGPLGYFYLMNVPTNLSTSELTLAWIIITIAMFINFKFSPFNVALFGYSRVREWYLSVIINRASFLLSLIIITYLDIGLVGVALCFLFGAFCGKLYAFQASRDIFKRFAFSQKAKNEVDSVLPIILPNVLRLGIVVISTFMSLKVSVLILSAFVGAEAAEPFNFWSSLFIGVLALSLSFANTRAPRIAQLWVAGEVVNMRREVLWIYSRATAVFIFISGIIFLIFLSIIEFSELDIPTLDWKWLFVFFLVYILELGHSLATIIIAAGNKLPFFSASIFAGVAIPLLSCFLIPILGGHAIIISQGLVQLLYNNWRWPLYLLRATSAREGK